MKTGLQEVIFRVADRRYPSIKEHDGPYNVLPEELMACGRLSCREPRTWNTSDELTILSEAEFAEVVSLVRSTVAKYGETELSSPRWEAKIDFFIVEEGGFDRTVKIEVIDFVRFWEVAIPLVRDLCDCLKKRLLWRIMFEEYSPDSRENVILVYPGGVRVDHDEKASAVTNRVVQIAEAKLRDWSRREHHRRGRRRELGRALSAAFKELEQGADPVVFVAAFDTISYPLHDTADEEGCPGRSIVLLFREERDYHDLHFTTEPLDELGYPYFATQDGRLMSASGLATDEVPSGAKLLLDFHPTARTIALHMSDRKWVFDA